MAALVQSFPQQTTTTVTMLQTRPSSASGILQSSSQAQSHHQYSASTSHMHRNSYHGMNGGGPTTYRGQTSMAPVAPYAFTSTPSLALNGAKNQLGSPFLRQDQRTASAPSIPTVQAQDGTGRSRYPTAASVSTTSTSSSSAASDFSGANANVARDDSAAASTAWIATRVPRPNSTVITSTTSTTINQNLLSISSPTSAKPTPDRYRRPAQRRADTGPPSPQQPSGSASSLTLPSGSGMTSGSQSYSPAAQAASAAANPQSKTGYQFPGQIPQIPAMNQFSTFNPNAALRAAVDDMHINRQPTRDEAAARYRRRSIHTTDLGDFSEAQMKAFSQQARSQQSNGRASSAAGPQHHIDPLRSSPVSSRPASSPGRSTSSESTPTSRSNTQTGPQTATKREPGMLIAPANPAQSSATTVEDSTLKHDQLQLVNIPPRGSSDAAKRIASHSPLSKPMTMSPDSPASKDSFASAVSAALQTPTKATYAQVVGGQSESPAAKQLAALNDKGDKKSKSSRLRRAFSFGSAAELRKASGDTIATPNASIPTATAERTRLRKERYQDEREAEQARIAQRQEEGGLGNGIYSGQGNFFSGSTDNLSISSTASSASIMIRKMGQGMKKSTRSLVGLFRPKSVIGVPAAESAITQPSQAQVSMVTVEAERERVNINADPHDQVGGGTGFPKLERNSLDVANAAAAAATLEPSLALENGLGRKSIIGGEKERAEVLAAVKKGILKRTGTDSGNSSPVVRPSDSKTPIFQLPPIPNVNDSPNSSAPSTPNEEPNGHKRTGSVTLGGEDYFMSALRFRGDTKSAPGTPQGTLKRNATFSPRIQFHDTWPSGEYDRRGEIATCNRLTPMLAQQIKEELNTFKMEMEVHENSKIYTHFF